MQIDFIWFELGGVAAVTAFLLWYYAGRNTPFYLYIIVFICWCFAFSISSLAPSDLVQVAYNRCISGQARNGRFCHPSQPVNEYILLYLWRLAYWTCIFLQYFIITIIVDYIQAGEFTFLGKLHYAFRVNLYFFSVVILIALPFVLWIFISGKITADRFLGILIGVSYLFNLVLVVLLLGYGLVEFPRQMWSKGSLDQQKRKGLYMVELLGRERDRVDTELEALFNEVNRAVKSVQPQQRKLVEYTTRIVSKCPKDWLNRVMTLDNFDPVPLDETYLADLHARLKAALVKFQRFHGQYARMEDKTIAVMDVLDNRKSKSRLWRSNLTSQKPREGCFGQFLDNLEWWLRCRIIPFMYRIVALILALASLIILQAEGATPFGDYSVFSLLLIGNLSSAELHIISLLLLSYIFVCVYTGLFKMKLFQAYAMTPFSTDGWTLAFSAYLSLKILSAATFHFFTLFHVTKETIAFEALLRYMDRTFGVLGSNWIPYFVSYLVIGSSILTLFGAFGRAAALLKIDRLQEVAGMSQEIINSGEQRIETVLRARAQKAELDRQASATPRKTRRGPEPNSNRVVRLFSMSGYSSTSRLPRIDRFADTAQGAGQELRESMDSRLSSAELRDSLEIDLTQSASVFSAFAPSTPRARALARDLSQSFSLSITDHSLSLPLLNPTHERSVLTSDTFTPPSTESPALGSTTATNGPAPEQMVKPAPQPGFWSSLFSRSPRPPAAAPAPSPAPAQLGSVIPAEEELRRRDTELHVFRSTAQEMVDELHSHPPSSTRHAVPSPSSASQQRDVTANRSGPSHRAFRQVPDGGGLPHGHVVATAPFLGPALEQDSTDLTPPTSLPSSGFQTARGTNPIPNTSPPQPATALVMSQRFKSAFQFRLL